MAIIHNVRGGTVGLNEEERLMIARLLVKAGYPSCVNTIKEIQQWKWKKDERTNTYLEEPVPFFDDAMAMLRYSIEEERKVRPRLNRNVKGGI